LKGVPPGMLFVVAGGVAKGFCRPGSFSRPRAAASQPRTEAGIFDSRVCDPVELRNEVFGGRCSSCAKIGRAKMGRGFQPV
jgi:hypothetical protein